MSLFTLMQMHTYLQNKRLNENLKNFPIDGDIQSNKT